MGLPKRAVLASLPWRTQLQESPQWCKALTKDAPSKGSRNKDEPDRQVRCEVAHKA